MCKFYFKRTLPCSLDWSDIFLSARAHGLTKIYGFSASYVPAYDPIGYVNNVQPSHERLIDYIAGGRRSMRLVYVWLGVAAFPIFFARPNKVPVFHDEGRSHAVAVCLIGCS